ncbi:hypothetical protein FGB62_36g13 [Gracilaria domingensis]|nr:hypothetical protein FGB62_36g13 [Gracilaria domingensis]
MAGVSPNQENYLGAISEQGKYTFVTSEKRSSVRHISEQKLYRAEAKQGSEYDKSLARQVFFFAQNAFRLLCEHLDFVPNMDQLESLQHVSNPQRRCSNWVFWVREMSYKKTLSGRIAGSKLPDFIGSSDFGNEGVRDPKKCCLVKLPPHLQAANPQLIASLVALAQHVIFPERRAES